MDGATGVGGVSGGGGSTHGEKWQIMPLGDSITGTTCYPKLLSQELMDKSHGNFTFVGTVLNNQACGNAPNVQTEGHGGYLVTYLTSDSHQSENKGTMTELLSWAAEKPDVVLMEYGTNDCWNSGIALSDITSAYGLVLDKFRAQNPSVVFFVAQITPLNPSGCSTCESRVEGLNALIPAWAASKTTAASPVYVVNVWSALDPKTYTSQNPTLTTDGVHPQLAAAQLMADKWYQGITAQGIP
jgi:lysophospholipase L1-like esterase